VIGAQTELTIVFKAMETQTCDDIHFEQIKLEIKKQKRYFQNKKAERFNTMVSALEGSNELVAFIEAITTPQKPPTPAQAEPDPAVAEVKSVGVERTSPEKSIKQKKKDDTYADDE